jgi:hypothetical protein
MSEKPNIPHQEIVKYILCGHTTRDAKQHFDFANDNVANLRIYAAFKALGITRPKYAERRKCQFCGKEFIARDIKQRTCGTPQCQQALIVEWHRKNPGAARIAMKKYRGTEKGRQRNARMHRRRRERVHGTLQDQWNFAADEIKHSLRKLSYLAYRNSWEYRVQHIQNMSKLEREFTPRNKRRFDSHSRTQMWYQALRAIQTTLFQYGVNASATEWEKTVNKISVSLRSGIMVRQWKRKRQNIPSPLIS